MIKEFEFWAGLTGAHQRRHVVKSRTRVTLKDGTLRHGRVILKRVVFSSLNRAYVFRLHLTTNHLQRCPHLHMEMFELAGVNFTAPGSLIHCKCCSCLGSSAQNTAIKARYCRQKRQGFFMHLFMLIFHSRFLFVYLV